MITTFRHSLLTLTTLALFIAANIAGAAPLSVRVDTSPGAPRIVVNGKPVRARIFYGQPASGTIAIGPTAKQVSFEFEPQETELKTATMHFRFGQAPGEIMLDDIHVVDLTTGKDALPLTAFEGGDTDFTRDWNYWPPIPQNTVGTIKVEPGVGANGTAGLRVKIVSPPNGQWPDFHFYHNANLALTAGHRYQVTLWVKSTAARNMIVAFYRPGASYVYLGGPPGHYESQVKLAAKAGVDFVSLSINMPWPGPDEQLSWAGVDSIIDLTLRANPHALIIPRVPIYAPDWWKKAHPNELMRWENGDHGGWAAVSSELFQREGGERLKQFVEHVEAKYGEHLAGYHPVGQNTGEWFYADSWDRPLNGYAPCDAIAFRKWLRTRYADVSALRTAWGDTSVDFDTAEVPTVAARHAAPDGIFRDPVAERPIIDFVQFQQDSMSASVCDYAHIVRSATKGRKLVLFFYGYVFEFSAISTGAGSSGHYGIRRVIDCPDIDIMCSPISYFDRGPGESAPSMTTAESVILGKKMWLNEDDTRTFLTMEENFPGAEHKVNTVEETNAELTRNVAQEAMRNFATWWMDLGATGWFDSPGLWARMALLNKVDQPMLAKPTPYHPEVAVVIDPRSMLRLADGGNQVGSPGVYEARAALGRMGAPYGQYLLDDVASGKVHAKLYVFLNAWYLDAKTRAALLKATHGAVCIWGYAPGYFDDYKKSLDAMHELTGFTFGLSTAAQAYATPTTEWAPIGPAFGVKGPLRPLFAVTDAKTNEKLAAYPNAETAVALRNFNGGSSIFVGAPGYTRDLLCFAASLAKVHLYTDKACNVYANGPFLALHASQDGPLNIDTGFKGPVTDVLTGKKIGMGPKFTLTMKRAQTIILKIK